LLGLSCTGGPISDLPFTGGGQTPPPSESNGDGTAGTTADAGAVPQTGGDGDLGFQDAASPGVPSASDAGVGDLDASTEPDGGTQDGGESDASAVTDGGSLDGGLDASAGADAGDEGPDACDGAQHAG
jgi:hypothetical protein